MSRSIFTRVWDKFSGSEEQVKNAPMTIDELARLIRGENLTASGISVTPEIAMQHSTVSASIRVLSESVGQLPLILKRIDGENEAIEKGTPLSKVITRAPCDLYTTQQLLERIVFCLCLWGNFYAYVNKTSSGRIVEIIPLDPRSVTVELIGLSPVYKFSDLTGRQITYSHEQIMHIKGASLDGLTGTSPVIQNSATIGLAIAAQRYGEKFFSNDAKPSGIVSTEESLSDEQYEQVLQGWIAAHKGADNSHSIALLDSGMKFHPITVNNRDSQFLESRSFDKQQIAMIFRVPLHRLQDYNGAKYSNVENQERAFYDSVIEPYLVQIVSALNNFLPEEYEVQFDKTAQLRGDLKTQAEFYGKCISMGVMSPDEVRSQLGMNPRPDNKGHLYVTDSNNLTFGENSEQSTGDNSTTETTEDETEES